MEDLAQMHCSQVMASTLKLTESGVKTLLERLPTWKVFEKDGELHLERKFNFENFDQALAFTNQVGQAANRENHHPALLTEWGKVTVTWWTHRIKGLHLNDFIMAAQTDRIFETLPK
jgi:4a-hydroxytetrahydrobiopterin dehydratase